MSNLYILPNRRDASIPPTGETPPISGDGVARVECIRGTWGLFATDEG